jgi:hypothetical protein
MDLADQVEVDEAVVHRRDQSVGLQDRLAGQASSRPGVSITTTSAFGDKPVDRFLEEAPSPSTSHIGLRERLFEPPHRRIAVLQIAGHRPLAVSRSSAPTRLPVAASAIAV